jgi:hypothetical protein
VRKNKTGCQVGGAGPLFLGIEWYVYVLWAPVFLVLFLLVVSCGGGGAQPTSFLYSDSQNLELISWQQDSSTGSAIRGQWTVLDGSLASLDPTAETSGFTGRLKPRQLTIALGGRTVNATLDGSRLQLPILTPSGQLQQQTWMAGSQSDYNALAPAFIAFHRLHAAQLQLVATVQSPPVDSDAGSYDRSVQTARQYVANISIQESKIAGSSDPCSSTGTFDELYPPDPSLFRLTPYAAADDAAAHTTLAEQLRAVQSDWRQASVLKLPSVPGLALPWVVSPLSERQAVVPGQLLYDQLLLTLRNDYAQMASLQGQSQRIGREVQHMKQAHGCA